MNDSCLVDLCKGSFSDEVEELIFFGDRIIVDDFDHVLVGDDRIGFLLFGGIFGVFDSHRSKRCKNI